jgi:hypothetical protein
MLLIFRKLFIIIPQVFISIRKGNYTNTYQNKITCILKLFNNNSYRTWTILIVILT